MTKGSKEVCPQFRGLRRLPSYRSRKVNKVPEARAGEEMLTALNCRIGRLLPKHGLLVGASAGAPMRTS